MQTVNAIRRHEIDDAKVIHAFERDILDSARIKFAGQLELTGIADIDAKTGEPCGFETNRAVK